MTNCEEEHKKMTKNYTQLLNETWADVVKMVENLQKQIDELKKQQ